MTGDVDSERHDRQAIYMAIRGGYEMSETARGKITEITQRLSNHPDVSEKVNTIYQFVLNGEGGGEWWFDLTKVPVETGEGINDDAACTITIDASDFVALVNKDANPVKLFMSGKLKIGGDISAAMKIQSIL